jgi:hypothetical protein
MRAVGSAHIIKFKRQLMANTYHQIYLQTVFAVKYRNAVIDKEWKSELFGVMCRAKGSMMKVDLVNSYLNRSAKAKV